MGDREARVLGSGDTITVKVKDKLIEYKLSPVVAKHLCDLEREALKYYKRQYLSTFSENMDLVPDGEGAELFQNEIRRVASWSLQDLPQSTVYNASKIPITDELKEWVKEKYGEVPEDDDGILALLNTALDQKVISSNKVKQLTNKTPFQTKVRYDQWWITACMEGMISFILSSVQLNSPKTTRATIEQWSFDKIAEAARKVESITSADMGNT